MFIKLLVPIVYSFVSGLILSAKEKSKNEAVKEFLGIVNTVLSGYADAISSGSKDKILQNAEQYFINKPALHLRLWESLGKVLLSLHPDKAEIIGNLGKSIIVEKKPFDKSMADALSYLKDKNNGV